MKDLRGTYVHRGDVERRRRRVRAGFMVAGLMAAAIAASRNWEPEVAAAADEGAEIRDALRARPAEHLGLNAGFGVLAAQLERRTQIFGFSRRYKIPADLAEVIYDVARAERIDPVLAFSVVRLESEFKIRATSSAGAIGLSQVMLPTARGYVPDITREQLYEPRVNLTIGFRYLRDLIREYDGNVQLALLVYNRGPVAVNFDRELGLDPSNGYERIVLKGYRGKGVLDD